MQDFVFCSPTKFVFGKNALDALPAELGALGATRALVVYGGGSVVKNGTLDKVIAGLDRAGIAHTELSGVRPNPEVNQVREGIKLARDFGADLILPIGGGSAIDCAKAIGVGVPYDGDVWDIYSRKAPATTCLPIVTVLTIPAAGSEGSGSSVISNDELGRKVGLSSELIRPRVSFMNPEITFGLPAYQTAAGVTDMIAHICERFFSGAPAAYPSDALACGLVRSVIDAALVVRDDPTDYDARATIMWSSTLAHNDLVGCGLSLTPGSRAGGWESHALEHEMSAYDTRITHGAGLAVIMPAWMRYVWQEHPERFVSFGRLVFGLEPEDDSPAAIEKDVLATIDALQDFFITMGMPSKLGELGLDEAAIDVMANGVARAKGDPFGGFRKLSLEDVKSIYHSTL